jgi:hypothetical protein
MRDMHEIVPIQDTLCFGIGAIEHLDGNLLRLWLYSWETPEAGGPKMKVVAARIVAPASAVPDAVLQMVSSICKHTTAMIPLVSDLVN